MSNICPVWIGYLLANPLRRLVQDPVQILGPLVTRGMTVVDVGCAMGYFTLPLAELVGAEGRVIGVDVQERMLRSLRQRAASRGVADRIEPRLCGGADLGLADLAGQADFVLAFAVVHEVPDPAGLFRQLHAVLRPGGRLLFSEPAFHIPARRMAEEVALAEAAGLRLAGERRIRGGRTVLLEKAAAPIPPEAVACVPDMTGS